MNASPDSWPCGSIPQAVSTRSIRCTSAGVANRIAVFSSGAFAEDRVIVTENARDFRRLVGKTDLHPGLIILPALDREGTWKRLQVTLIEEHREPMNVTVNHVVEVDESGKIRFSSLPSDKGQVAIGLLPDQRVADSL